MLAFSGCTQELSPAEAEELRMLRYEILTLAVLNNQLIFLNSYIEFYKQQISEIN